jgi:type IX secretion system PorP/SprF family membrane protein
MMRSVLIILFALISFKSFAQPQTNFTAFPYAIMLYNPAYAGSEDHINVSLLHKSQWLNQPGSPVFQGLSAHLPVNYERIGLGLNVLHESAGIVQSFYMNGSFSYKINLHKGRLAFGMRMGLLQRTEQTTSLLVKDKDDALLADRTSWNPEFGGGLFYKEKKYFVGLSFTRSSGIYLEQQVSLKNHYHLMAGTKHTLGQHIVFKPVALLKYTKSFTPYASCMLPVEYKKLISLGCGYSTAAVFSVQSSLHIDKVLGFSENNYTLTYAYDQSLSKLNNYIGNTHEFILSIKFVPSEKLDRILKRKITVSPLLFD